MTSDRGPYISPFWRILSIAFLAHDLGDVLRNFGRPVGQSWVPGSVLFSKASGAFGAGRIGRCTWWALGFVSFAALGGHVVLMCGRFLGHVRAVCACCGICVFLAIVCATSIFQSLSGVSRSQLQQHARCGNQVGNMRVPVARKGSLLFLSVR